jgi:hypothetical protein
MLTYPIIRENRSDPDPRRHAGVPRLAIPFASTTASSKGPRRVQVFGRRPPSTTAPAFITFTVRKVSFNVGDGRDSLITHPRIERSEVVSRGVVLGA